MSPQSPVSDDFSRDTLLSESGEVYACLIEIDHPDLTGPYRISSDRTEFYGYDDEGNPIWCTRHQGNVYYTHEAFAFVPPGKPGDGAAPQARFVVSWNPEIMAGISNIHEKLTLRGVYINVADPDVIIQEFPKLLLNSVEASGGEISATLGIDHFLDEPCGRIKLYPSLFPALFKNGVSTEYV